MIVKNHCFTLCLFIVCTCFLAACEQPDDPPQPSTCKGFLYDTPGLSFDFFTDSVPARNVLSGPERIYQAYEADLNLDGGIDARFNLYIECSQPNAQSIYTVYKLDYMRVEMFGYSELGVMETLPSRVGQQPLGTNVTEKLSWASSGYLYPEDLTTTEFYIPFRFQPKPKDGAYPYRNGWMQLRQVPSGLELVDYGMDDCANTVVVGQME